MITRVSIEYKCRKCGESYKVAFQPPEEPVSKCPACGDPSREFVQGTKARVVPGSFFGPNPFPGGDSGAA